MTVTRLRAIFQKNDTQMPRRPAPKSAPRRVIVHASVRVLFGHFLRTKCMRYSVFDAYFISKYSTRSSSLDRDPPLNVKIMQPPFGK